LIAEANNNRMSGGFPHSDIHGSKPIPGSPWLNAGYHVLHRLLLPRHPPNALFALDLIQKEQGHPLAQTARLPSIKSILTHRIQIVICIPVSVLDLEQYRLSAFKPDASHTREHQTILMFSLYTMSIVQGLSLIRVQLDDQTHPWMSLMI
jgi:hypothetical protein